MRRKDGFYIPFGIYPLIPILTFSQITARLSTPKEPNFSPLAGLLNHLQRSVAFTQHLPRQLFSGFLGIQIERDSYTAVQEQAIGLQATT
ncbi:MAG: hypothetical protein R3C11_23900 [Planctomycetaceae bacterium]